MANTKGLQDLTAAVSELETQQVALVAAIQNGQQAGATDAELQPLIDRVNAVAGALKAVIPAAPAPGV